MNKKEHKLVKYGQFEEETPKTESKFKVLGLWKLQKKSKLANAYGDQPAMSV